MRIIDRNTRLSDIVKHEPNVVTVLNRFGIRLGVGEQTVASASEALNINPDFLATLLNAYLNEDFYPTRIQPDLAVTTIVDYLDKTNGYYHSVLIPNIERHFGLLISRSPSTNNNLGMMRQFFEEVKQQLFKRIEHDRQHLFPELLAAHANSELNIEALNDHGTDNEDTVEDKLADLISMFVVHLRGDYDTNLALAVLLALVSLKNDITQNNRIRYRILHPLRNALTPGDE